MMITLVRLLRQMALLTEGCGMSRLRQRGNIKEVPQRDRMGRGGLDLSGSG
jgi:hypothetical protein